MSNTITKSEVTKFKSLRDKARELQHQLELTEAARDEIEATLLRKIDSCVENKSGYTFEIKRHEKRYPKWRELFVQRLSKLGFDGADEAEKVLRQTEPTVSRSLIPFPLAYAMSKLKRAA